MGKAGSKQTRQRILKLKTKELKIINGKLFRENIRDGNCEEEFDCC
jgi:hypothetical protein